ncbi:flagellar export chaperone FliS [Rhodoferax sp. 4810]|nr:flagellar export chaperone FliS [Rhodoferax jenense]
MFTSISQRSAAAYQRVSIETDVSQADPHKLVGLLFDRLLQVVSGARVAMQQGQIASKGESISKAVRIIDEGLKPALNLADGGDIAANLNGLYGYCVLRLSQANLNNDDAALADVLRVIEPIAQGWKQIGAQVGTKH